MNEINGIWDWGFAMNEVLPRLFSALKVTLSATLVGFALAVVLGLMLTFMRRSNFRIFGFKLLAWPAIGFIEFIRSTPLLVQLYFIFFVFPLFGLRLSPFAAGVIGLGVHYSTYLSEVYRAGIDAVPRGQWEAARALNFSPGLTWTNIILPQAIPPVIPMIGNYLITMFKETPMLSAITLLEMVGTAKVIGAESFRYIEPMTIAGLLFLALSYPSAILVRRLEERMNRRRAGAGVR